MLESPSVRDAVERFYAAFTANDRDAFDAMLSTGPVVAVGSAPHEFTDDRAGWLREFGMPGVRLEAGDDMRAFEEGDVGWAFDRPRFVFDEGTLEVRMTVVLRREDGAWKFVHLHASVGVADEEAIEPQNG